MVAYTVAFDQSGGNINKTCLFSTFYEQCDHTKGAINSNTPFYNQLKCSTWRTLPKCFILLYSSDDAWPSKKFPSIFVFKSVLRNPTFRYFLKLEITWTLVHAQTCSVALNPGVPSKTMVCKTGMNTNEHSLKRFFCAQVHLLRNTQKHARLKKALLYSV